MLNDPTATVEEEARAYLAEALEGNGQMASAKAIRAAQFGFDYGIAPVVALRALSAALTRNREVEAELKDLRRVVTGTEGVLAVAESRLAQATGALEAIAASQFGLQNVAEDHGHDSNAYNFHAMKYWAKLAQWKQSLALAALKSINSLGDGEAIREIIANNDASKLPKAIRDAEFSATQPRAEDGGTLK